MLRVVGIGPGSPLDRTPRAAAAILASDVVVGYKPYLERVADLLPGREIFSSGMTKETDRVRHALQLAAAGRSVALISSGDAGIYGMAGLAIELKNSEFSAATLTIQIIPGITAASSAAARLGAPLMLDYATISLSDLLVPLPDILHRLEAAVIAGFVIALYNPQSTKRREPFAQACAIFSRLLPPTTPVGIVTAISLPEETITLTDVASLPQQEVTMLSTVIVGNATSKITDSFFQTPRGYPVPGRQCSQSGQPE